MPETEKQVEIHAAVTADCDLLYHYTSTEGLLGIIEQDNIRATHVRFLNDWTEFREAFTEKYVPILVDSFRAGLPKDFDEAAERVLSRRRPEILGIIESSGSTNETFVCSFTESVGAATQDGGDPRDVFAPKDCCRPEYP
jgi:hypothetical protein